MPLKLFSSVCHFTMGQNLDLPGLLPPKYRSKLCVMSTAPGSVVDITQTLVCPAGNLDEFFSDKALG